MPHLATIAVLLLLLLTFGCTSGGDTTGTDSSQPVGARLTEREVLAIAEPELAKRYPASFERDRPYRARFSDGTWHVYGTLPEMTLGGTPEAYVRDADGRIERITHGR
jgi:hypothetical protein